MYLFLFMALRNSEIFLIHMGRYTNNRMLDKNYCMGFIEIQMSSELENSQKSESIMYNAVSGGHNTMAVV